MIQVPYLMYHEIKRQGRDLCVNGPGYTRYAVRETEFHEQLALLSNRRFRALNVTQAITSVDHSPSVVLTFDDGCETDLTVAVPALQEFGFSATFYVVSGFIGRTGYLSRSQLKEISDKGFEVGCHSRTHANLCTLDAARLHEEVAIAKTEIEQIIGREVMHFSCPEGFWCPKAARAVSKAGFATLATSRIGLNSSLSDPYRLARIAMYRGFALSQFEKICRGGGLFLRRGAQSFLQVARTLLGEPGYLRVRSTILSARVR